MIIINNINCNERFNCKTEIPSLTVWRETHAFHPNLTQPRHSRKISLFFEKNATTCVKIVKFLSKRTNNLMLIVRYAHRHSSKYNNCLPRMKEISSLQHKIKKCLGGYAPVPRRISALWASILPL